MVVMVVFGCGDGIGWRWVAVVMEVWRRDD